MIDAARFAAIAESIKRPPTDAEVASIAELARKQQRLEARVERRKKLLKLTEEKLARVAEVDLPNAMSAVGMAEFALDNGFKVTVGQEYFANIPAPDSDKPELLERRAAAFRWLKDNKHGDLIKAQILIEAGRGEQEKAERVMRGLDKAGIAYSNTEAVHWQTLRAFVKEQLESDRQGETEPFPEQLFGVHIKRVAKVKPATKK